LRGVQAIWATAASQHAKGALVAGVVCFACLAGHVLLDGVGSPDGLCAAVTAAFVGEVASTPSVPGATHCAEDGVERHPTSARSCHEQREKSQRHVGLASQPRTVRFVATCAETFRRPPT
jgi:hypothetical protein